MTIPQYRQRIEVLFIAQIIPMNTYDRYTYVHTICVCVLCVRTCAHRTGMFCLAPEFLHVLAHDRETSQFANSVPQKSTTYADGSGAVPLPEKIGDHAMIVPQLQQFVRVVSDREVSTLAQLTKK